MSGSNVFQQWVSLLYLVILMSFTKTTFAEKGDGFVWYQKDVTLDNKTTGCHWVTDEVLKQLPEMKDIKIGTLHLFLKHTSASICVNESYDPSVCTDMKMALNKLIPENWPYKHTMEGPDDMPAHIKTALMGHEVTIPINNGRLNMGTWQGLWFCEHRSGRHSRTMVATIMGCKK